MDERMRDAMVAYLCRRIDEFGIKLEDFAPAIKSERPAQTEARFRNATGDSWDGRGEMPQWLKQAISAGQSIQHFELPLNVAPEPLGKERVDWQTILSPEAHSRAPAQVIRQWKQKLPREGAYNRRQS